MTTTTLPASLAPPTARPSGTDAHSTAASTAWRCTR